MRNTIFLLIFCSLSKFVKSEIIISYSIFDLCMQSNYVAEAHLEKNENENFIFRFRKYGNKNDPYGKIMIPNLSERYDLEGARRNRVECNKLKSLLGVDNLYGFGNDTVNIDNADKIILFLNFQDDNKTPIIKGTRIIKNGIVFYPIQISIPGKLSFSNDCEFSESKFYKLLQNELTESDNLKNIIYNPARIDRDKKTSLRKWLKNYFLTKNKKSNEQNICINREYDKLRNLMQNKKGNKSLRKIKQITLTEIQNLY